MRVAILDGLQLRLELLHPPHRDDALVAQRPHHEVDQDRQDDDRPAVVADEAVHPLQRAEQRHRQDREHPEVDHLGELGIDLAQRLELLRADEEPQRRRRRVEGSAERHQLADGRRVLGIGQRLVREIDALTARGVDDGGDEVVVVDAEEAERAVLRPGGAGRGAGETGDLPSR